MSRACCSIIVVLAAIAAISPGVTHAEPSGRQARLDWQVPDGADCIDRERLVSGVRAMLGREVFTSAPSADRVVRGRLERGADGGWVATVTLLHPDGSVIGTRRVATTDPACTTLDEPLGLVVALLVDAPAESSAVRVPARPAPATDAPRFSLLLEARGSAGLVGPIGGGGELTASLEWTVRVALELSVGASYGESSIPEGTAELVALEAALGACAGPARGRWRLRLCAGGRGGALHAGARGFEMTLPETRPLGALAAWARLTVELGAGLGLVVTAGLGVPLVRDRFLYVDPAGDAHELHQASSVHALFGLGVEWAPGPAI